LCGGGGGGGGGGGSRGVGMTTLSPSCADTGVLTSWKNEALSKPLQELFHLLEITKATNGANI